MINATLVLNYIKFNKMPAGQSYAAPFLFALFLGTYCVTLCSDSLDHKNHLDLRFRGAKAGTKSH